MSSRLIRGSSSVWHTEATSRHEERSAAGVQPARTLGAGRDAWFGVAQGLGGVEICRVLGSGCRANGLGPWLRLRLHGLDG